MHTFFIGLSEAAGESRFRAVLAASMLLGGSLASAAEFRAGAAAVDITPTNLPVRTAGNLTLTLVNKVHDPLHARALVLDDGSTKLAIAVVDSCMIAREDLDEAKAAAARVTGIPVENMLISATHTHTAPAVSGVFQSDPDPEYQKYLTEQIAKGIEKAAGGVHSWEGSSYGRTGSDDVGSSY